MFTEILNSFLNVRNKVKDADGNWVDQTKPRENQHLTTGLAEVVAQESIHNVLDEWGKKIVIDAFEFGADGQIRPALSVVEGSTGLYTNNIFHVVTRGGLGRYPSSPGNISAHASEWLEVISAESDDILVNLKKPIVLPQGCSLYFRNDSSSPITITYKVYWREIEG
jgi:hypothetical protein